MPFPTTRWSLLAQAAVSGEASADVALAEFYRRYRQPVLAFIARQPARREQAEDLAQEFFLHLIENSTLRRASAGRGRFRSFLLGALLRFLARERSREGAEKRGAGEVPVSLDNFSESAGELSVPAAVAREFDREWARDLLARAWAEVETDWAARGEATELATLRNFLPGAVTVPTYEAAAAQLGWPLARLKTEVFRLRAQFREQVRAEITVTVDTPPEVDAEIAHLYAVLSDSSA